MLEVGGSEAYMRVALLRCQNLPKFITWDIPNLDEYFTDDNLLVDEFRRRGVQAYPVVWRDPTVEWNDFDVAIVRTTWDYIDHCQAFLDTLAVIDNSSCKLFNPLEVVQWNYNKKYLLDLMVWEIPTIPTWIASLSDRGSLASVRATNSRNLVLKPCIGTGGQSVLRCTDGDLEATLARMTDHPSAQFLIQPFVESVVDEGEWSFFYFGRKFSHAMLKKPAIGDYRAHGIYGGTIELVEPSSKDIDQANLIFNKLPFDLLYARLDLIRLNGNLSIVELECIEPILYFNLKPSGSVSFVDATLAKLSKNR